MAQPIGRVVTDQAFDAPVATAGTKGNNADAGAARANNAADRIEAYGLDSETWAVGPDNELLSDGVTVRARSSEGHATASSQSAAAAGDSAEDAQGAADLAAARLAAMVSATGQGYAATYLTHAAMVAGAGALAVGSLLLVLQDETRTNVPSAVYEKTDVATYTFRVEPPSSTVYDGSAHLLDRHHAPSVKRQVITRSVTHIMESQGLSVNAAFAQALSEGDNVLFESKQAELALPTPLYHAPAARRLGIRIEPGVRLKLADGASRHPDGPVSGAVAVIEIVGGAAWDAVRYPVVIENYGEVNGNQTNNRSFAPGGGGEEGRDVHGIKVSNIDGITIRGGIVRDVWWACAVGDTDGWHVHDLYAVDPTPDAVGNSIRGSGLALQDGARYGNARNIFADGFSEVVDLNPLCVGNTFNNIVGKNIYEAAFEFSGAAGTVINGLVGIDCREVLRVESYSSVSSSTFAALAALLNTTGADGRGTRSVGSVINGVVARYTSAFNLTRGSGEVVPLNLQDGCTVVGASVILEGPGTTDVDRLLVTNPQAHVLGLEVYAVSGHEFAQPEVVLFNGGHVVWKRVELDVAASQTFHVIGRPGVWDDDNAIVNLRTAAAGSAYVGWDVATDFGLTHYHGHPRLTGVEDSALAGDAASAGFSSVLRVETVRPRTDTDFRPFDLGNVMWGPGSAEFAYADGGVAIWKSAGGFGTSGGDRIDWRQATAANQPAVNAGPPFYVAFDGSNDFYSAQTPAGASAHAAFALRNFALAFRFRPTALSGEDRFLGFANGSNWRFVITSGAVLSFQYVDTGGTTRTVNGPTLVADTDYTVLLDCTGDGAAINMYVNDPATPAATGGGQLMRNTSWGTTFIFGSQSGSNPIAARFAEAPVYLPGGGLSSAQRTQLDAYLDGLALA